MTRFVAWTLALVIAISSAMTQKGAACENVN